jgi:hypothetical protein
MALPNATTDQVIKKIIIIIIIIGLNYKFLKQYLGTGNRATAQ